MTTIRTEANKVFVIGADRISTDLHNLVVDTNATLAKPLDLDYEYNDPSRSEQLLHAQRPLQLRGQRDSDRVLLHGNAPGLSRRHRSVDRILFPKLTQIAQLVYEIGFNAANTDKALERDNKGPRSGRGFEGRIRK